jgi:putative ABC transport system permease protein
MLLRLILQSWRRQHRRRLLAVVTIFLAATLVSALLAVSIDIGDKMARELKTYGANILIEPASQSVLPELLGDAGHNPLAGQDYLDEKELPNIKDIFWRNNIMGFAPELSGIARLDQNEIEIEGTFFDQDIAVPDEEDYRTGQKVLSPYWQINGEWPDDRQPQILVGQALAAQQHLQLNQQITLQAGFQQQTFTISGILHSGAAEDQRILMPLKYAQQLLDRSGKLQRIRVSALTVPENALSRKARQDLESLTAQEYDLWYCTAYVSSIAHQLEDAISGSAVRPIWQVAASEGVVIEKIQLLLAVVTLVALLASSMGIASLMTSNLLERAKEIGLMKALGAELWQIYLLFYAEAALSGIIGGLAGCVAGWGCAYLIGITLFGNPLSFGWIVVPVVVLLSVVIALTGTWFPARQITKLYPVEVLYGR